MISVPQPLMAVQDSKSI